MEVTESTCSKKTCPLKMKQDSAGCTESCAWYNPIYKCCHLVTLSDSITDLREIMWNWFKKFVEPLDSPGSL